MDMCVTQFIENPESLSIHLRPFLQAYALYLRSTKGSLVRRQSELKSDIMKTKQELSRTSAQDQFAKWAKLRRSIDKNLSDLEKLSAHNSSSTLDS